MHIFLLEMFVSSLPIYAWSDVLSAKKMCPFDDLGVSGFVYLITFYLCVYV